MRVKYLLCIRGELDDSQNEEGSTMKVKPGDILWWQQGGDLAGLACTSQPSTPSE